MNEIYEKNDPYESKEKKRSKQIPIWKFVLLSVLSMGLYELYWMYKNWKLFKEKNGERISPFWRAFFALFFINSLFKRILELVKEEGYEESFDPLIITIAYIAITITYKLPDPIWLVSILSFAVLIPGVKAMNYYWSIKEPDCEISGKFTAVEWLLSILGGAMLVLALIGTFMP